MASRNGAARPAGMDNAKFTPDTYTGKSMPSAGGKAEMGKVRKVAAGAVDSAKKPAGGKMRVI